MKNSLDAIFKPRSVAIIGASNNPEVWGFRTLKGMMNIGYRHNLIPINPTEKEIQGLRCYPSVLAVPGEIDLAVIVVNAALVGKVVEECIAKKVKGGIVITAGFAELGADGATLQRSLAEKSREAGFYFIGPNCLGVRSSEGRVNTMFWEGSVIPAEGPVSFISQSGTLGDYFFEASRKCGFGVSKFISCGNQASITFLDLLEYLGNDPSTAVITGYVEDIIDGRRFMEVAAAVSAKKPLLLYKAGGNEASSRAARSHTAAMGGNDKIFDAVCRQAGAIRFYDFMEMFNAADALCFQPLPAGNRVAIISGGGGFCVTAADACARTGLEVPELSVQAQAELRGQMLPFSPPPLNPIDCIGTRDGAAYNRVIEIAARQEYIDALIVMPRGGLFNRDMNPQDMIEAINSNKEIAAIPEKYNKPLIMSDLETFANGPVYEIFKRHHIPYLSNPVDCARALYGMVKYNEIIKRKA